MRSLTTETPWSRRTSGALFGVGALALATGLTFALAPFAPNISLGGIYLLAVLLVATRFGLAYAIPFSCASFVVYAWFFLSPLHRLSLEEWQSWVALAVYNGTAIAASSLASQFRQRASLAEQARHEAALLAEVAEQGRREAALLAEVSTTLLQATDVDEELGGIAAEVAHLLGAREATIALVHEQQQPVARGGTILELTVAERRIGSVILDSTARPDPALVARIVPALASLLATALDRRRLAREAVEAEALRRSDAVKTAILRVVSHDLRSPLTAIRAAGEGLRDAWSELGRADREALLATICAETARLEALVTNLLDLSRLEAGAAMANRELWPLDELVAGALESVGAGAERVDVELPAAAPAVMVDAVQIERVLANLFDNALKFSRDGPVRVSVELAGDELIVHVRDAGPGVAAAEAEGLFKPFARGAEAAHGVGLGLAIARGFAELNGGRVWAESVRSGGSFAVALPASGSDGVES